jgi:glucan phosphoethanolaminetransferase (alkaline phosphatase superfamily)
VRKGAARAAAVGFGAASPRVNYLRINYLSVSRQKLAKLAVLGTAVAVAAAALGSRTAPVSAKAQYGVVDRHPNILLITFDAMSAEDMSPYGYRLPTTPRIGEFASKRTVFTNFYSASTLPRPAWLP